MSDDGFFWFPPDMGFTERLVFGNIARQPIHDLPEGELAGELTPQQLIDKITGREVLGGI